MYQHYVLTGHWNNCNKGKQDTGLKQASIADSFAKQKLLNEEKDKEELLAHSEYDPLEDIEYFDLDETADNLDDLDNM